MKTGSNVRAFTLIEMLVVIVIIGVLAGMVLKLMTLARGYQSRAACVTMLERVSHAINEYRAEYGTFPPVATNACPRFTSSCTRDCRVCFSFVPPDSALTNTPNVYNHFRAQPEADSMALKFGLVSYLISRVDPMRSGEAYAGAFMSNVAFQANVDSEKDENAKKRWAPYLEGIIGGRDDVGGGIGYSISNSQTQVEGEYYYVPLYTIKDPWDHVIRYRSSPPYTSYELWSAGPDGDDGDNPNDSETVRRKKAADNVHKSGRWDE